MKPAAIVIFAGGCSLLFDGSDLRGKGGGGDLGMPLDGAAADDLATATDLAGADLAQPRPPDLAGRDLAGGIAFTASSPITVGKSPWTITSALLDGDANPDLVVSNNGSNTLSIILGSGVSSLATCTGPTGVAAARFDNNASVDLVVTCHYTDATPSEKSETKLFTGNGAGAFTGQLAVPIVGDCSPYAIAAADFDGNTVPDIAIACYGRNEIRIHHGNGAGLFSYTESVLVVAPYDVRAAQLNNTGIDLVALGNTFSVFAIVNDSGGLGWFPQEKSLGAGAYGLALADFNGDTYLDVVSTGGDQVMFLANSGTGTLADPVLGPNFDTTLAAAAADFDGNGKMDVAIVLNGAMPGVQFILGNGVGAFTNGPFVAAGSNPRDLVTGDFNSDGRPDVAMLDAPTGGADGKVYLLLSR